MSPYVLGILEGEGESDEEKKEALLDFLEEINAEKAADLVANIWQKYLRHKDKEKVRNMTVWG